MDEKRPNRAKGVLPRLKAMKTGDTIYFPIEWMDTVRAQTSKCNLLYGGRRSTRVDSVNRRIYVDRKN